MSDSTTQLDVEEVQEVQEEVLKEATPKEDAQEEPRLERNSLMDDLAAKRNEQFEEESGESFEEDDEPEEDTMMDLKVDGEVIQKLKSEVDAEGGKDAYQMKLAADKRFKEAAEEKKRLVAYEKQLKEKELYLSEREREQREQEEEEAQLSDAELAQGLSQGFYEGDTEAVEEKLMKIIKLARKKNEPVDREQIINEAKFQIQRDEGVSEFNRLYPNLTKDKMLFDLTNRRTAELMNERPDLNPKEIILLAAEEVNEKFKPKEEEKPKELEAISQKKKTISTIKKASSRKPSQQEFKPETKDEIFSRYKKNRSH